MKIRRAESSDETVIRKIYHKAFEAEENELVADLACQLMKEQASPGIINLVADDENDLLGHTAFSPVFTRGSGVFVGYILAPIAVKRQNQKKGIGKKLIEFGLKESVRFGATTILVYGDPGYYSRFGFKVEVAENYIPPFELKHPFGWQGIDYSEKSFPDDPVPLMCVKSLNKPELW